MLLITPSEVVEYAFMPREQISPQVIRPAKIDVAAEHFVRPRFGDELYDKFTDGEYAPFVEEFLKPALAHYVRYALVDELSIQMSNSGAVLFDSMNQQSLLTKNSTQLSKQESTAKGTDKSTSQSTVSGEKTVNNSSQNTTSGTEQITVTGTDESTVIGDKSGSNTVKRGVITTVNGNGTSTSDVTQSLQQTTIDKTSMQNDYSYNEAPASIGVAREGYEHETGTGDKKVTGSENTNKIDTQDTTNRTEQKFDDTTTVNQTSTSTTTDSSKDVTSRSTSKDSSGTLFADENSKQSNIGSGTAETLKELSAKSDNQTIADGQTTIERQATNPASDSQRQILSARALADANILIAKAVRYVERHVELFPEYRPQSRSYGGMVL